jgi:hypothetical protein
MDLKISGHVFFAIIALSLLAMMGSYILFMNRLKPEMSQKIQDISVKGKDQQDTTQTFIYLSQNSSGKFKFSEKKEGLKISAERLYFSENPKLMIYMILAISHCTISAGLLIPLVVLILTIYKENIAPNKQSKSDHWKFILQISAIPILVTAIFSLNLFFGNNINNYILSGPLAMEKLGLFLKTPRMTTTLINIPVILVSLLSMGGLILILYSVTGLKEPNSNAEDEIRPILTQFKRLLEQARLLLSALGLVLAIIVFTTGAFRLALIDRFVEGIEIFPKELLLVHGLFTTLMLLCIYLPVHAAIISKRNRIIGSLKNNYEGEDWKLYLSEVKNNYDINLNLLKYLQIALPLISPIISSLLSSLLPLS